VAFGINWDNEPDRTELARLHNLYLRAPSSAIIGLELLAGRGSTASMWYLADILRRKGGPRNNDKAVYWFELAQKNGLVQASHMLGRISFEDGNYERAFSEFSAGANMGYPPSIFRLAWMHIFGQGTATSLERAAELFAIATSKGHLFAKRDLATFYLSGRFGARQIIRGIAMLASLIGDMVRIKMIPMENLEERILC
jgi:TPR repeat protein